MYYFLHQSNPPPPLHHHLLLITFSLLSFFFQNPRSCQAQDPFDPILVSCPLFSENYTSGSRFEYNLKNLLIPALLSNGPLTGYFNFIAGNNNIENVYGLIQCRGDISKENCRSCLNAASVDMLQTSCPNKLDATIRYENCLLRYSNVRFFSQPDSRIKVPPMMSSQTVSDKAAFNRAMEDLLDELVFDANSIPPSKFQARSKRYQESNNVYGLVQCTQDISATDCFSCLRALINYIPMVPDMYGKRGGRVISKSCVLRYEDILFYQLLSSSPPPPQVPPSPTPSTNVGVIVDPIVAGVTLIALCVCYITI